MKEQEFSLKVAKAACTGIGAGLCIVFCVLVLLPNVFFRFFPPAGASSDKDVLQQEEKNSKVENLSPEQEAIKNRLLGEYASTRIRNLSIVSKTTGGVVFRAPIKGEAVTVPSYLDHRLIEAMFRKMEEPIFIVAGGASLRGDKKVVVWWDDKNFLHQEFLNEGEEVRIAP